MPRSKRSKAQIEQLKVIGQGWGSHAPDNVLKPHKLSPTEVALNVANNTLANTQIELQTAMEANASLYKAIRVERRKGQRMAVRKQILEGQINFLQSVELPTARGDAAKAIQLLKSTTSDNEQLTHKLSRLLERCTLEVSQSKAKNVDLDAKLAAFKKQNCILKKRCDRAPEIKAKAVKHAKSAANKENRTYKLLHKGAYSPQARELARMLVSAGCSREYVSNVIHAVCKSAGVAVKGSMSRRTVSRAILEGGIAAKIQIGHELAQAEGMYLFAWRTTVHF